MSISIQGQPSAPTTSASRKIARSSVFLMSFWTALLIGSEAFAVATAGIWAGSGLLHLAPTPTNVLYAVGFAGAGYVTLLCARTALRTEGAQDQTLSDESSRS